MLIVAHIAVSAPKPIPVAVVKDEKGGYRLTRGGKPYFVQGVGGSARYELLKTLGGNSIRSWGTEKAAENLEAAQKAGITQTVGIWLQHKAGLDYNDPAKVAEQKARVEADIIAHRDHPALLMWGLGNEMENGNDIPALWKAVDDLHVLAARLDPNHPAMTVVTDFGKEKIVNIMTHAPHIKILGINSYAGAASVGRRLREAGWNGPFVLTEFGPRGPWELPKTPWGAALEPTSTEKAASYADAYGMIADERGKGCLGSYAFLWGNKQEETPTWFGMFLPTGEAVGAADVAARAWGKRYPKSLAPEIARFEFAEMGKDVAPGARLTANVAASDRDEDKLTYEWRVMTEVAKKSFAGEGEARPLAILTLADKVKGDKAEFAAPKVPGAYRLYLTIRDGKGRAATANGPFRVVEKK